MDFGVRRSNLSNLEKNIKKPRRDVGAMFEKSNEERLGVKGLGDTWVLAHVLEATGGQRVVIGAPIG